MSAVVTLKKGEGRTIKAGGAWIFDNEIASILGAYENGDIVLVRDFDGYPMGRGFINEHSKIRIRMMTRNIDQEIDEAFLDNILSARNSNFFTQELFEQISNIDWASAINKMDNMDRGISYTFVKNFANELKKHPSVIRSNTYF